jgi:hypothetical protein
MDLKTLGAQLAKIGLPLLGAALPIPGGMAYRSSRLSRAWSARLLATSRRTLKP